MPLRGIFFSNAGERNWTINNLGLKAHLVLIELDDGYDRILRITIYFGMIVTICKVFAFQKN
jgi:hypothetical protein